MYGLGNLGEKVTAFTARVVKANKYLKDKHENILADQFFRSGTSIGANCSEAVYARSISDYLNKLHIALKETNETEHWIDVIYLSNLIDEGTYKSIKNDCVEIAKILCTMTKKIRTTYNL